MNERVLSIEEERFLVELLTNIRFDLLEDGNDGWDFLLDEIDQGLLIFGKDASVPPSVID